MANLLSGANGHNVVPCVVEEYEAETELVVHRTLKMEDIRVMDIINKSKDVMSNFVPVRTEWAVKST